MINGNNNHVNVYQYPICFFLKFSVLLCIQCMCDKFILISDWQELAIGNLTDIKKKKKIPEFNSLIGTVTTKTYVQMQTYEGKVTLCDLVTNKLSLSLQCISSYGGPLTSAQHVILFPQNIKICHFGVTYSMYSMFFTNNSKMARKKEWNPPTNPHACIASVP